MNWGSVLGIVIAILGLVIGQALEGGHLKSLIQVPAFIIVILGTMGAVMVQTEWAVFLKGMRMIKWVLVHPTDDRDKLIKRVDQWSQHARKEGVFMLEPYLKKETEPFIIKGLQLMVDGTPPDRIREICAIDMYYYEIAERNAVKVWSAAGGYAPTVGILGAVLGLIHVMENLSDPSQLGAGIAVSFVATIYGVGLANLVFLPIANRLKNQIQKEIARREMLLNAWVSIARGDHPKIVHERLGSYVH